MSATAVSATTDGPVASDAVPTTTWGSGPPGGDHPGPSPCAACAPHVFAPGDLDRPALTSPEAAADLLAPLLAHRDRERCVGALLDTKHRVIEVTTISIGSIDHTFMSPREVFRDALLANASAIVLGHNHPSGDPEPSRDDELLTRRLVRAGELVGVDLLDHLVVGGSRWVSLARRGVV